MRSVPASSSGTVSTTHAACTSRECAPYQRCALRYGRSAPSSMTPAVPSRARSSVIVLPQSEPVEATPRQREEVRKRADARKARPAEHLLGFHALEARQVQLD